MMPVEVLVHQRLGLHDEVHHLPEVVDSGMRQGLLAAEFLPEQWAVRGGGSRVDGSCRGERAAAHRAEPAPERDMVVVVGPLAPGAEDDVDSALA